MYSAYYLYNTSRHWARRKERRAARYTANSAEFLRAVHAVYRVSFCPRPSRITVYIRT